MGSGAIIIAEDVLRDMIEQKGKGIDMLKLLSKQKMKEIPFVALTPLSSFLRAISESDSKIQIKNIKKVMEVVTVIPASPIDYTEKEEVIKDIVRFAGALSGREI